MNLQPKAGIGLRLLAGAGLVVALVFVAGAQIRLAFRSKDERDRDAGRPPWNTPCG
jgi:hypothetical protein